MNDETGKPMRELARGARVPRVLVVDDEKDLRELMELTMVGMGLDVDVAADLAHARSLLAAHKYALCLTDMRLPDGNGLDLVRLIGSSSPETPVAVITAFGSAENAVAALKAGAFDYLAKPVGLDALRALVRSALQLPHAAGGEPGAAAATRKSRPAASGELLLGESAAVAAVRASIARMARSMAPVAISGESGSGKELAARMIHRAGARPDGPFIAVNCGAIPENLMESEFFGYRKGAFTGAESDRAGIFSAADGGTLFLDEVADLPPAMQVKLLRAIQEKRIRRVGSVTEEPVDVRIISATHQDLARCVAEGRFRQDLFYRLAVIDLRMPPLRERLEDIPVLAEAILRRLAERSALASPPVLSTVALRYLQSYHFPGNVRELENILERALAFSDGKVINVENLGLRPIVAEEAERERSAGDAGAGVRSQPAAHLPLHLPVHPPGAYQPVGHQPVASRPAAPGSPGTPAEGLPADDEVPEERAAFDGRGHGGHAGQPAAQSAAALLDADGVPRSLPDYLDAIEREAIRRALEKTGQNRTAAARLLGITFRALRYRMQRLDLS